MFRQPCVYILANQRNGTLYVGITSDLPKRIWEHKSKAVEGFTQKYGVDKLVCMNCMRQWSQHWCGKNQ